MSQNVTKKVEDALGTVSSFTRPLMAHDWRDKVETEGFNADINSIFRPRINATCWPVVKPTCEDSYHCGFSFSSLTAARLWLAKHKANVDINSFWHGYLCRVGVEL